jgi:hypothetical protein
MDRSRFRYETFLFPNSGKNHNSIITTSSRFRYETFLFPSSLYLSGKSTLPTVGANPTRI